MLRKLLSALILISSTSHALELECRNNEFPATLKIILNTSTLETSSQAALVMLPKEDRGQTPIGFAAEIVKSSDKINEFRFTSGKPINWIRSKEKKCWVRNGNNTTVLIREFPDGLGGSFFASPRIDIDPRVPNCDVPKSEEETLITSQTISCKFLN